LGTRRKVQTREKRRKSCPSKGPEESIWVSSMGRDNKTPGTMRTEVGRVDRRKPIKVQIWCSSCYWSQSGVRDFGLAVVSHLFNRQCSFRLNLPGRPPPPLLKFWRKYISIAFCWCSGAASPNPSCCQNLFSGPG
jgi:hypothetical protein